MNERNEYVYKMEVNWSVLTEGLTLPVENQVAFGKIMSRYLNKGEHKTINIYLNGKTYAAKVVNVNYSNKYQRKHDVLQIRYPKNGELAQELQKIYMSSYQFFNNSRKMRPEGSRSMPNLPEEAKEYLAIYTTEYDDTYEFETIETEEIEEFKHSVMGKSEYLFEVDCNVDMKDGSSTLIEIQRTRKIRKLNKKIGDNLKLFYEYRCQICGRLIGEEYGSHIAEAHHIDYFVNSLNNDSNNQMILCPNHHSIIHDANPIFHRPALTYIYDNGYSEQLTLNKHLR